MTTREAILHKMKADFSANALKEMYARPVHSVERIKEDNCVLIKEELMEFLENWFNNTFCGDPVEIPWKHFWIDFSFTNDPAKVRVYVCQLKDSWISLDVFFNDWDFVGKILYPNIKCAEENRAEDGRYGYYAPFLCSDEQEIPKETAEEIVMTCVDIFLYCSMYTIANMENEETYETRTVQAISYSKESKKSRKTGVSRKKEYLPRQRKVFTVMNTPSTRKSFREYKLSHWKVQEYSYVNKNGKLVHVREHIAKRHLPNKGLVKPEGVDYVIVKPK